jgi:hypothetical protein
MKLTDRIMDKMNQHLEAGESEYDDKSMGNYIRMERNVDIFGYDYYAKIRLRGWRARI